MTPTSRRWWLTVAILMGVIFNTVAQTENDCSYEPEGRVEKLLDKAQRSNDLQKSVELLYESLEKDPDCLPCKMELGKVLYYRARNSRVTFSSSIEKFMEIYDNCPNYHSDVLFYLGIMHYSEQNYVDALKFLKEFREYDASSGKISGDYEQKLSDVEEIYPETKFYGEFYNNIVPFEPTRVEGVSTSADEYLPMLSPDNSMIFFTRKEKIKRKGELVSREVERFVLSERKSVDDDFDEGEPLPPPFNVGDNYGGVTVSLDNRELFVTVCKPTGRGHKNCDLYSTTYEIDKNAQGADAYSWSGLENLGPAVNTPDGWEAQPTLSADGKTIYFATVRANSTTDESGNPTIDIYYSTRNARGEWQQAKPMKGPINTDGNDKSPFLHADSRTLYFSSNGRLGAGGYDLYYSRQKDDGSWEEPRNIGYPINTQGDEHGLVVSTDGKTAYFASNKIEGAQGLDIFSFDLHRKAQPDNVLLFKGEVRDENGDVVKDARIQLKYLDKEQAETIEVDSTDGSYAAVVNIEEEKEVVMKITSPTKTFAFNSRSFTLADTAGGAVKKMTAKVEELKVGEPYTIPDINFATNSAVINDKSAAVLRDFAEFLEENPSVKIEIRGHTDNVGTSRDNLVLSTERAFEVMGFIQQEGIDGRRMRFKGYGEKRPVASNDTPEGRAENRRTEFIITSK